MPSSAIGNNSTQRRPAGGRSRSCVRELWPATRECVKRARDMALATLLLCSFGIVAPTACQDLAAEERLAVRAPPRILAEFRIERDGGPVIVPVTVEWPKGGRRSEKRQTICRMLLDTGATHTLFHDAHHAWFGKPTGKVNVFAVEAETFKAPVMRIGNLTVCADGDVWDRSWNQGRFRS